LIIIKINKNPTLAYAGVSLETEMKISEDFIGYFSVDFAFTNTHWISDS